MTLAAVKEMRHRWAEKFPFLGTDPISAEQCVSQEAFDAEREKIYPKVWWMVGRVEEIPNHGDYKVRRLDFANTSAVIINGKDGKIRAFHNACSHRGNKPVKENSDWDTYGRARGHALTCRFHGWVYNTQGDAMFIPDQERFFDLDPAKCGLKPISCDTWNGFIFISLAPTQSLSDYLGDIGDHLSGFPYGDLPYVFKYHAFLKGNWKVCADAFQEAYHAATIHAGTFPDIFYTTVEEVQVAGPHRSSAVVLNLETMRPTAVSSLTQEISENSITQVRRKKMLPSHVNPNNRPDYAFEMPVIFPFTMIALGEGVVFTHVFYPVDKDNCVWEGAQYIRKPTSWAERFAAEHGQVLQRDAWLEDTETMEDTHAAIKSGAKPFFQLQDEEVLVRHQYHAIKRYLEAKKDFTGRFTWGDM